MNDRCDCDLCNGLLTGAWEDEVDWEYYDQQPDEYDEWDPYEDICPACGELLDEAVLHTMELCSHPWYWAGYDKPDRDEMIKRDRETGSAFSDP